MRMVKGVFKTSPYENVKRSIHNHYSRSKMKIKENSFFYSEYFYYIFTSGFSSIGKHYIPFFKVKAVIR